MTTAQLASRVDRWLAGFATSRGVESRRVGPVTEVDVATESRRLELVLVEPAVEVLAGAVARIAGTSDIWITVFSSQPLLPDVGGALAVMRLGDERLMMRTLGAAPGVDPRTQVRPDGARAFASVMAGDVVAAQGQVAVVGRDAVFDRISTHEDFRRRGLGRSVMDALTTWAVGRGAETGLLAASRDGQALYARLGWQDVGHMLTLASA